MKSLYSNNELITPDTVIMQVKQNTTDTKAFRDKNRVGNFDETEIYDMAYDSTIDSSDNFIDITYKQLLSSAFNRFVSDAVFDMKAANDDYNQNIVLAKAKGIIKVNEILYNKLKVERTDHMEETQAYINNPDEYVRTLSQSLNTLIGGFTRGYVNTIGAKSGHTKSSWTDANILQNLLTGKISKVVVITPEESPELRLRRMLAAICKIPISQMRQKSVEVTNHHIKTMREKLGGKLELIGDAFKYEDVVQICNDTDADMVYIDHLQSLVYPGRGSAMDNMIGNIPGLINIQKKIAKKKNSCIINLSQVSDKTIQRSDRLIKVPRYWDLYGSSVLYQAARELVMLWYPIKDYENQDIITMQNPPSINDVELRVEKSSFSATGRVLLHFNPEFNSFSDKPTKTNKSSMYIAPHEPDPSQLNFLT